MLIDQVIHLVREYLVLIVLAVVVCWALYNKYGTGLSDIPGPFLAGYTDLWRLWVVWNRRPEVQHIRLHEKYGDIVRLGPRAVSIANPEAIKTIYAPNAGFSKSGFYPVQQTVAQGRSLHSMFNTTDEKFHATLRRSVSNAYAMSTLVGFEPMVDSTSLAFIEQIKRRWADKSDQSGICDFGTWLQYYAFDVIGELTFSKRLGFVDRGVDVDDIIGNLEWLLSYVAVIGQIPFLDKLFLKNPIRMWLSRCNIYSSTSPVVKFARKGMSDREHPGKEAKETSNKIASGPTKRDFLSRFLEARDKNPAFINDQRVLALTVANMFAGSDTTAISLRAIFYNLLKSPSAMEKLLAELKEQADNGNFKAANGLPSWEEVRDLPYLGAVIKEGLRCHPAVGLTLERVVPAPGMTISGRFFPAGTIVGCNAWVIHRNEQLFGAQPELFRPERWLERTSDQLGAMNNNLFSFGAGARTCIGKNVSLLEMHKLVPAVLQRFELELVYPDREWKLHNAWFVKQSDFMVRFKSRQHRL